MTEPFKTRIVLAAAIIVGVVLTGMAIATSVRAAQPVVQTVWTGSDGSVAGTVRPVL